MDIKSLTAAYTTLVITIRRALHRIPELGGREEKTSAYVADYLRREGEASAVYQSARL